MSADTAILGPWGTAAMLLAGPLAGMAFSYLCYEARRLFHGGSRAILKIAATCIFGINTLNAIPISLNVDGGRALLWGMQGLTTLQVAVTCSQILGALLGISLCLLVVWLAWKTISLGGKGILALSGEKLFAFSLR